METTMSEIEFVFLHNLIHTKIQPIIIAVGDGSARLNVENERRLKDWANRRQLQHDSPVPAVSMGTDNYYANLGNYYCLNLYYHKKWFQPRIEPPLLNKNPWML